MGVDAEGPVVDAALLPRALGVGAARGHSSEMTRAWNRSTARWTAPCPRFTSRSTPGTTSFCTRGKRNELLGRRGRARRRAGAAAAAAAAAVARPRAPAAAAPVGFLAHAAGLR